MPRGFNVRPHEIIPAHFIRLRFVSCEKPWVKSSSEPWPTRFIRPLRTVQKGSKNDDRSCRGNDFPRKMLLCDVGRFMSDDADQLVVVGDFQQA